MKSSTIRLKRHIPVVIHLFAFWSFYLRKGASSLTPWIKWQSGGHPGSVEFRVLRDGRPVAGVAVDTESFSGTSGKQVTDSSGVAVIANPSENVVVWIHVNHERISLRPLPLGEWFFSPSSKDGLIFSISL